MYVCITASCSVASAGARGRQYANTHTEVSAHIYAVCDLYLYLSIYLSIYPNRVYIYICISISIYLSI